jgi:hypothetical protein
MAAELLGVGLARIVERAAQGAERIVTGNPAPAIPQHAMHKACGGIANHNLLLEQPLRAVVRRHRRACRECNLHEECRALAIRFAALSAAGPRLALQCSARVAIGGGQVRLRYRLTC